MPVRTRKVVKMSPLAGKSKKQNFDRDFARRYFMVHVGRRINVCKRMFLHTFGVSDGRVNRVLEGLRKNDGIVKADGRGKHKHRNKKISDEKVSEVEEHIGSLPKLVSHSTRSHSASREYLSSNLTVNEMYRLYKDCCCVKSTTPVKPSMYRYIFNTRFNLSFHVPVKDTCRKCVVFKVSNKSQTDTEKKKSTECIK